MARDFFDDDLIKPGPDTRAAGSGALPPRQVGGEINLTAMSRQKEEITQQVTSAVRELEELRIKQQELEREKSALEGFARKQDDYQQAKQAIIQDLTRSIMVLEKEEVQAAQVTELLSATRARFKASLTELQAINENAWGEGDFQSELDRAAALVENTRIGFRKAMGRVEALTASHASAEVAQGALADKLASRLELAGGFGFWLKAGLAFSLPLILVLVLIALVWWGARAGMP